MRAVLCHQWGEPDSLSVGEAVNPEPGPDQVKIRVRAAALNFADILMVGGTYQEKPPFPFSPGLEVAGEIMETGERVMAVLNWGGFAEYAVAHTKDVMAIPDTMSFTAAAAIPIAYGTAHMALVDKARLGEGESLIVHGASGGVGLAAIDVGKAIGANVIAVSSGADKITAVLKQGADHVIDYKDGDVKDQIKALLPGGGDVYFDPVGGSSFDASLRSAAPGARILVVGFAGGNVPQIPANILMVKNVTAIGFYWGAHRKFAPDSVTRSFKEILDWIEQGRLNPLAVMTFNLDAASEAMNTMKSRRSIGKIVLQDTDQ
ncbi:MAG: NADPH:quinone oxidoreductase family protein [Rhodospirillaceae bacterium]|nr:NADPH:quinone oxidoreductase family protein [Rhodospirillaceae bacterium]MBT5244728.1 NADPH:quinone oxidoreductase family protein [Rhodospirillaceae bacterium]MBT5562469.1 NADPH:quinone oxidoreductase family protein [Rhodospirillaceae bacterium]MBT6242107.1 NADPH:quinone oxidoreductase family protein [Rhodospirillaceae bacterium]MBT7136502.1 NADPH:quinone oxidoreductase family protein [Rhodospirillaceae bacterium]